MDAYQVGYWIGYGYALSGAAVPDFYNPVFCLRAQITVTFAEEFGDGMFAGYHDALKS